MGWEGMVCDEMVWNEWYAKANILLDQNIKAWKQDRKIKQQVRAHQSLGTQAIVVIEKESYHLLNAARSS
jgi:hypothetical protein